MRMVFTAICLIILLALGWVLKGLISDHTEREFAVHYSWIVKWALTLSRESRSVPEGASFSSPRIEVAGNPNRWMLSGRLTWRDANGQAQDEPYTAVVANTCKAYADPDCWRLDNFASGEAAVDLAEAALSTPPAAEPTTQQTPAAPTTSPQQNVTIAEGKPAAPAKQSDAVLSLLQESSPDRSEAAVPEAPSPPLTEGVPLPELKPVRPARTGETDTQAALSEAAQDKADTMVAIQEAGSLPRPADTSSALADSGTVGADADRTPSAQQANQEESTLAANADHTSSTEQTAPIGDADSNLALAAGEQGGTIANSAVVAAQQAPAPAAETAVASNNPAANVQQNATSGTQPVAAAPAKPVTTAEAQPVVIPPAKPATTAPSQTTPEAPAKTATAATAQPEVALATATPPLPPTKSEREASPTAANASLADLPNEATGFPDLKHDPALVVLIQDRLNRAGYDAGLIDGRFGARTQHALMTFQREAGLPVDGQPSTAVLAALDQRLVKKSAAAQPAPQPQSLPEAVPQPVSPPVAQPLPLPAPTPQPQVAAVPPSQPQPAPTPPTVPPQRAATPPTAAAQPPSAPSTTGQPVSLVQPEAVPATSTADESLIFLIQNRLRQAGYSPGRFDGRMDEGTANAIRAYQAKRKLPVNGIPSRALLERLESELLQNRPNAQPAPTPLGLNSCLPGAGVDCAIHPA